MAARKPLFLGSAGFHKAMPTTDSITLGGLTMGGNIDMNSAGKIINCVAADANSEVLSYGQSSASWLDLTITGSVTNDTHAATKAYVDATAITGGPVKEAVLTNDQLHTTQGINAAIFLALQNQAANDDRVVLTDGTTTRTYYFGTGTGDVQVTIGADANASMQNLATAINGDGSAIWGAYYSTQLSAIDANGIIIWDDTTSQAVSKIYGTNWDAGDCQIVDFGGETDYTKQTLTDIPSSAPGSTNFGFRRTKANLTNGEMHIDLQWDIIFCWDDDSDVWQAYSGSGSVIDATGASGGGTKGKATFDSDKGLSVTSGIAKINLDTNSGLEFNSGGLRVKVASSNEITRDATGLYTEGVPDQFKINGVATNTLVSAGNLQTLVASGNADSLHDHTATSVTLNHSDLSNVGTDDHHAQAHVVTGASDHNESGLTTGYVLTATAADAFAWQTPAEATAAEKIENSYDTATDATTNGDPIYINGNSTLGKADADTAAKARVAGIIRTGAGAAGSTVEIVTHGPCPDILSGATANTPYYLQSGGGIGTSLPGAGKRVVLVGYAIDATDLFVKLEDYGQKAA